MYVKEIVQEMELALDEADGRTEEEVFLEQLFGEEVTEEVKRLEEEKKILDVGVRSLERDGEGPRVTVYDVGEAVSITVEILEEIKSNSRK